MTSPAHRFLVFHTAAGHCGLAWNDDGITRFQLPSDEALETRRHLQRRLPRDASAATPPADLALLVDAVRHYFDGEAVDFSGVALDLAEQDTFSRAIYAAARRLTWGQTTTYGALAKAVGAKQPEAARDVGQAMARNPVPLIIPCHRVLAAGGRIGGFSAPGGLATKTHMLMLENVDLSPPPPAQQSLGF